MIRQFLIKLLPLITLCTAYISACTPAPVNLGSDVHTGLGQQYHVLKLPVMQHNIGSEWSKKYGATGKGALTEDRIQVDKSLKRLDRGTEKQIALGISALSGSGTGGNAGVGAEAMKQMNLHGLQLVKPVALGYIPFKRGIAYVTEAIRLEGFAIDNDRRLSFQAGVTGTDSAAAGLSAGTGANSGYGGEGLVLGYIVQTVDDASYAKQDFSPVALALNGNRATIGDSNISARASFEKVVAGSGKSLPRNLLWACRKAASKKDAISAAWVVTLHISGDERKTLKIAFPAHPEIEDCSDYESIVTTGINSTTDKIERTVTRIFIDQASVNEMLDPVDFKATVSVTRESFTTKTIQPEIQ